MNRKNKNLLLSLLVLFAILTRMGCATGQPSVREGTAQKPRLDLVWPRPPDAPRIRFVQVLETPADVGIRPSAWGSVLSLLAGRKQDYLQLPQQVAVGPAGRLYVSDRQKRTVHIFDLKKKRYVELDKFNGQHLYSPAGIAEADDGLLYVSDSISRKILVFDSRGKSLFDFGGPDVFQRPTGLVFLPQTGNLYVVDTLAQNLKVFDKKGNLQFQFGQGGEENGNFNHPTHIAHDRHGRIYVTDPLNHRIQVFNADGTFVTAFGRPGDAYGGFSKPKGVAVDSEGNIYVVDAMHDVVQIFNLEGQLLLSFCGPGSSAGELWLPSGIAIDAHDRIYVADTYNKRVQVFQLLPEEQDPQ